MRERDQSSEDEDDGWRRQIDKKCFSLQFWNKLMNINTEFKSQGMENIFRENKWNQNKLQWFIYDT